MACTCGHAIEEHGSTDPKRYPNEVACLVDGCDCVHFEDDGEDEEDE